MLMLLERSKKRIYMYELIDMQVVDEINNVGKKILSSKEFSEAKLQPHHRVTTVADHSYHVAYVSLKICKMLNKKGIETDNKSMIIGALSHDLGMLNRDDPFDLSFLNMAAHPKRSVKITKNILEKDFNNTINDIIVNHMWPCTFGFPKSLEARIIIYADKYCAVRERTDLRRRYMATHLNKPTFEV